MSTASQLLRRASVPLTALFFIGTLLTAYSIRNTAYATHLPANKVAAAGSTMQSITQNGSEVLLREEMKVSSPEDLILQVTAECSIITQVATESTGASEAQGQIKIYVTIDGHPVPVSSPTSEGDAGDNGRVVFCDRIHRQTRAGLTSTVLLDDRITQFLATRTANAFNWAAINASQWDTNGDNVLEIAVVGEFLTRATPDAPAPSMAQAFVGNRTLVVEPLKFQNDENTGPVGEGSTTTTDTTSTNGKRPR